MRVRDAGGARKTMLGGGCDRARGARVQAAAAILRCPVTTDPSGRKRGDQLPGDSASGNNTLSKQLFTYRHNAGES
jgi:hypothetical protein